MASALETLVKILKLEREQGYKDTAVIGGFSAYRNNWIKEAHEQARIPQHHALVDEIGTLLAEYGDVDNKTERHKQVSYMLDRITGRVPPPPEYREKEKEYASQTSEVDEQKAPQQGKTRDDKKPEAVTEQSRDSRPDTRRHKEPRSTSQSQRRDNRGGNRPSTSGQMDIAPKPRLARAPRRPRPQIDPDEAADIMRGLKASVTTIRGVGDKLAEDLQPAGIENINDLLFYLPRRYDDYTELTYISRLQPEQVVTIIGTVIKTEVRVGRNGRKDFVMTIDDGSAQLSVLFFGQHFLIRTIRKGEQIVLSGKTSIFGNRLQMTSPEWEKLDNENLHTTGIVPVYPLVGNLKARSLRRLMKRVVDYWAERIPDYIPEATLERAELGDLGWALKNLHFPESMDHLEHAQRRFIFDELLLLQLAVLANRFEWQRVPGEPLEVTDDFLETFVSTVFPFELTQAQQQAIADIRRDVTGELPMNRLLQGDVGAGKTAVAAVAMAMAYANRKQSAIMAPTSILAEQHYRGITALVDNMPESLLNDGYRPVIALLTSALNTAERESIYRGMADGSIDMVIGTHALIQDRVEFKDLAVVVIDEQHRFGVEQRKTLRGKGTNPHLLVMTATPIPRTLALTIYADLDLSILDEKPPGRQPIQTRAVELVARERINSFVESQLEQGRQAFIVHPLVEASEKIEAASAIEAFERLSKVFFRYRVCLLHGRMKPAEKDEVMAAFANHEYDVMVTTSVAEVGVDVPNASVMIIEGANRFGLAQLHQFRGRVGRGEHQSYCLLVPDSSSPEANERLQAMENIDDGFKLAEIDWKLRGAGDLVGTRQSGGRKLILAELMTPELVEIAQRESRTIYEEDPELNLPEHRLLAQRVRMLHNPDSDVS